MKLSEVPVGTNILVQVYNTLCVEERYLTIFKHDSGITFFEPIWEDNKLLNFSVSEGNRCDLIYFNRGRATVFRNAEFTNLYDDLRDEYLHTCPSKIHGDSVDNRSTQRYVVQMSCQYTRGIHRSTTRAMIRDVSLEGMGVVIDGRVSVGDTPTMVIDMPSNYIAKGRITVSGEVVRIMNVEDWDSNDKKLVGIKLSNPGKDYRSWVMALEVERSRKLRGKN